MNFIPFWKNIHLMNKLSSQLISLCSFTVEIFFMEASWLFELVALFKLNFPRLKNRSSRILFLFLETQNLFSSY